MPPMNELLVATRAVNMGASVLLVGIIAFVYCVALPVRGRQGGRFADRVERPIRRLAALSLALVFVSALAWLWLETANMTGRSLPSALTPDSWEAVLAKTGFSRAWKIRLGAILVSAAGLLGVRFFVSLRRVLEAAFSIAVTVVLTALAWAGHAVATSSPLVSLPADALHLLAAGTWVGGLLPLAIFLRRSRDVPELAAATPAVVQRFSAMSLASVGVLTATGFVNSWFHVGSWHGLIGTTYGRLLLIKLACFVVMLAIGGGNLWRYKQQIAASESSTGDAARLRRHLRRRVVIELALGTAILLVVAVLGVTPPARRW